MVPRPLLHAEMHISLQVKCPLLLSILIKIQICQQIFVGQPNIKCYENPFSGSQVDACREMDGLTERMKLLSTVLLLLLANATKKVTVI
jgi:hypothetical protein